MALATKAQSQKIFEKLKTKPANKVSAAAYTNIISSIHSLFSRCVSIVAPRIPHGPPFLSAYTSVLTAHLTTVTLVFTYPLSDRLILTVSLLSQIVGQS